MIYAPISVSSYSTLLPHLAHNLSDTHSTSGRGPMESSPSPYHRFVPPLFSTSRSRSSSLTSEQSYQKHSLEQDGMKHSTSLDEFRNVTHTTFPTPCELLVKFSEPDCLPSRTAQQSQPLPSPAQTRSLPTGKTLFSNSKTCQPDSGKMCSSSAAGVNSPSTDNKHSCSPLSTTSTSTSTSRQTRPENIHKSYFRIVKDDIGFELTDP